MLARLRTDLLSVFMIAQSFEPEDCAAANVAYLRLLQSPYFEGAHANLVLVRHSEKFFKLYREVNDDLVSADPLDRCYDRGDVLDTVSPAPRLPTHPALSNRPWKTLPPGAACPSDIEARTSALIERLLQAHPSWETLVRPAQRLQRQTIVVEHHQGILSLNTRLRVVLGDHHDRRLIEDGISFHNPHWENGGEESPVHYLLAHNGQEVAGLLRYVHRPHEYGLAFICVAPGFRGRGISHRLYAHLIEQCETNHCVLKRSEPSDFTLDRPTITASYDRQLSQSAILHTASGSHLLAALVSALDTHPYETVVQAGRSLCNDVLTHQRTHPTSFYQGSDHDRLAVVALRGTLEPLVATPVSPRNPRRGPRSVG